MFKKFLFLIAVAVSLGAGITFADERVDDQFVYLFHLYYDNGQLFADRDYKIKYDLVAEEYVAPARTSDFMYQGKILNFKDEPVGIFSFDPQRNGPDKILILKGKISVKAPYAPDGEKALFLNSQGQQLLTIPISDSAVCNNDQICQEEKGESYKNCASDCREPTATPAPSQPAQTTESKGGLVSGIVAGLIGILIIVGLFVIPRIIRRRRELSTPPGL